MLYRVALSGLQAVHTNSTSVRDEHLVTKRDQGVIITITPWSLLVTKE
jgi:hypothetical protein